MLKISWMDKVTNEEVLAEVMKQEMLNTTWGRTHWWIGHVLQHEGLLFLAYKR